MHYFWFAMKTGQKLYKLRELYFSFSSGMYVPIHLFQSQFFTTVSIFFPSLPDD